MDLLNQLFFEANTLTHAGVLLVLVTIICIYFILED